MSDFPWENDRELFMEVMNHGRFFLNMQLFQDVRDRDQMKVDVSDCPLWAFVFPLRSLWRALRAFRSHSTPSSSTGASPKAGRETTRPTAGLFTGVRARACWLECYCTRISLGTLKLTDCLAPPPAPFPLLLRHDSWAEDKTVWCVLAYCPGLHKGEGV